MKGLRLLAGWLILITTLSSCQKANEIATNPELVNLPTDEPSFLPSDSPIPVSPTSPPEALTSRTQYRLQAVLNYPLKTLEVKEEVNYTNRSRNVLNDLVLCVEANQTIGVFNLESAQWENSIPIEGATLDGVKLTIPLPSPLNPQENVHFAIQYQLALPSKPGVLSFGDRQINLSGWYPVIVPYISESGWLIHAPGKVGEFQVNELADFNVLFQIEESPDDLKMAASSPWITNEKGWNFTPQGVRNITLSFSPEYEILEGTSGKARVRAYVFPEHIDAGTAALLSTTKAIDLYSDLFGSYDRSSLTLVESTFPDGMEYDGLYFLGQEYFKAYSGGTDNYLTTLSAHETAHQWWYAMTANDQAFEPWLDEALATYSERLFYEHEYPDQVNWWEFTRIQAYQPKGAVNSTIYDFIEFRPYVNAVYLRGAKFLQALRDEMGDEVFFSFMKDYFTQMKAQSEQDDLGLATADNFWQIVMNHYSGDLNGIKQQFFK